MKLVMLFCALAACSHDDTQDLRDEADAAIRYYTPILDSYTRRMQRVIQESGKVPKNLPGSDQAVDAMVRAHDKLVELRKIPTDVHAAMARYAAAHDHAGIVRTLDDELHFYREGCVYVNELVSAFESWFAQAPRLPSGSEMPPANDVPEGVIP